MILENYMKFQVLVSAKFYWVIAMLICLKRTRQCKPSSIDLLYQNSRESPSIFVPKSNGITICKFINSVAF